MLRYARGSKVVLSALAVVFGLANHAAAGVIVGQGDWDDSRNFNNGVDHPATGGRYETGPGISWQISWDGDSSLYTYSYSFFDGDESLAVSHFILQLSEDFSEGEDGDVFNVLTGGADTIFGETTAGDPGSSTLPADIDGVKIEGGDFGTLSFETNRGPMWGNFYWKTGNNFWDAWNAGLVNDPPTDDTDDFTNWIPVPNEHTAPNLGTIPTPAAAPMGALLLGILAMRRGRRA